MRYEEYIKQVMDDFAEESLIAPDAFPVMELYADQVAGFFGERLHMYAKDGRKEPDAAFTEAVVSRCVKRGVLPRPVKKKYTRDHLIIMAMLFYMKSALRMSDMERVMRPFLDNHASTFDDKIDFHRLYTAIEPVLKRDRARLSREIRDSVADVKAAIRGEGLEDDDNTELLLLLLSLAARADTARYAARKLVDEYFAKPAGGGRGRSAKGQATPAPGEG
jgi:signal transduction histidine kinase